MENLKHTDYFSSYFLISSELLEMKKILNASESFSLIQKKIKDQPLLCESFPADTFTSTTKKNTVDPTLFL